MPTILIFNTTIELLDIHADIAPSGVNANLLADDLNDVIKYLQFVEIKIEDVRKNALPYHTALNRVFKEPHETNAERASRQQLQRIIESDVESLILFSVMALDRMARFTEQFLGKASQEWDSFDSFTYLAGYAAKRELSVPAESLLEGLDWLKNNVVMYRHLYLAHRQEGEDRPRYGIGVSVSKDANINYGVGSVSYPKETDKPYTTTPVEAVVTTLAKVFLGWTRYLIDNAKKPS